MPSHRQQDLMHRVLLVAALFCWNFFVNTLSARADDWPCWRGPDRNGISKERGWRDSWSKGGPRILWRTNVGIGFSTVAVSKQRLFTLGHNDGKDTVYCFDASAGKKIWNHSYPAELGDLYFEGGTTSTPTVDGEFVYVLSRWGDLFCFSVSDGAVRWSKNIAKETGQPIPAWGFSGSPVVLDDLLVLNVGRAGTAVEKATGKLRWTSDTEEPGYSTPLPFQHAGQWFAITSHGKGYSAVNVKTGKELWDIRWLTRYGVNASDPIPLGEHLFISTGYTKGASLWKVSDGSPSEVWRNRKMRNQFNPCVLLDGYVYGVDGDTSELATLKCMDVRTGDVMWSEEGVGSGAVTLADGRLIVLTDQGELITAPASPAGFKPTSRAKVIDGKCWTVPVLANGKIFCRSSMGELVAVDVSAP